MNNEKAMFGMSEDTIRKEYMNSLTARLSGQEMVVAGILSDCQELISFEQPDFDTYRDTAERIRKQLNVAKFILFEMMDAKRAGESKYIGESV
ncbi:MAG: hypothetical protein EBU08_05845 [Micrococcales bacterium]|nr:hypothetical protein [Micrococcales bacterium]